MLYRLERDEFAEHGLRRVVLEEVDCAVVRIADPEADVHETVHEVRKGCKRIRAALQLFRGSFAEARLENARFRDAAKGLGPMRDLTSMIESFEETIPEADSVSALVAPVGEALRDRRERLGHGEKVRMDLGRALENLREGRPVVSSWTVATEGWEAVSEGFEHVYRRGRRAHRRASLEPTAKRLHEWRKWVKYHGYHLSLLEGPARLRGEGHADAESGDVFIAVERLGNQLGKHHDLHILEELLPGLDISSEARASAAGIVEERREGLQREALLEGARIYSAKPRRVREGFERAWRRWREFHDGG